MIYRAIVERKLRNVFAALNRGDHGPILESFGSPVEHTFFGDHALAGTRFNIESIRAWYRRLQTIFPDLQFEIVSVAVSGAPWNTVALVEWRDRFTLRNGARRGNQGVHAIGLKWGKATSLRVYCDTQLLGSVLRELQSQGVPEAGLPPIDDRSLDLGGNKATAIP